MPAAWFGLANGRIPKREESSGDVADREDLKAKEADIVKLVNLWMEATAD